MLIEWPQKLILQVVGDFPGINSTILEHVVERGPLCKCPPPVFLCELQAPMSTCSGQYDIVIMYKMAIVHAYSSRMFPAIMQLCLLLFPESILSVMMLNFEILTVRRQLYRRTPTLAYSLSTLLLGALMT